MDPRKYHWDGAKRGGDASKPFVIVQYTLAGMGIYEQAAKTWELTPGECFIALVPSGHRYYLPERSPSWTFFYIIVNHDYAVARLCEVAKRFSPVLQLAPDSAPVARLAGLFHGVFQSSFRDDLAVEQALLDFVIEYERHARSVTYPENRQSVLDQVRNHVLGHLNRPVEIAELARHAGMSRSHYSHYFRAATGHAPAGYITEIRLQEVARRLTRTRDTLKQIAGETGFADANHLCKVFRRHFRTSPAQFRGGRA